MGVRRREEDVDLSSDNSKLNSSCKPVLKKNKLVLDIVLPENDEINDIPRSQRNNKHHSIQYVEGIKKIETLNKKKNVLQNKTKRHSVKEKKKGNENLWSEEMVMLNDFKNFTDALIDEFKVAREKMLHG
ncbi:unnamed protein product [Fraxinus pennsylvanica]|uniref:Uncharacterized protein n=1 Tax=Fraxinus pennsylvanica TaxID=56036 RepID=A0AAD2E1N7_9LAMI|nr:unnamed protein product [Fraxinus pennsylvanica]